MEMDAKKNSNIINLINQFFNEIPESASYINLLSDFKEQCKALKEEINQKAVIGRNYEKQIPKIEKHIMGQYYTPQLISDLISELTVSTANDKILDCSCGIGIFLLSAYKKLIEFPENNHSKILNQLTGIEINAFPAYFTAFNLLIKNLSANYEELNIYHGDFFNAQPYKDNRIYLDKNKEQLLIKKKNPIYLPCDFDVIITNPPYTEAREIGNIEYKKKIRAIALDHDKQLSKTIGIHGYFYTHANHFLKEKGRIGFIVNNSFMETKGGWTLCKYFLDNFKIKYMISFSKNIFDNADVKAVVTILEKCSNKVKRDENKVKFVKVNESFEVKDLTKKLQKINSNYSCNQFGIVTVKQKSLNKETNWMVFFKLFNQINLFLKIFDRDILTKLEAYCDIRSCFKGGGYEFFFIKKEDKEKLHFEPQYLEEIIHTPRNLAKLSIKKEDIEKYVLKIDSLDKLLKTNTNIKKYVEKWMKKNIEIKKGYTKGKIITGIQNMPTFEGKSDWFNVVKGNIKGDLLFQGYIDRYLKCYINDCNAYSAANYVTIKVNQKKFIPVIALILNSSLLQFYFELKGKIMGANALAVANYIIKSTKIPNLKNLPNHYIEKCKRIFELIKELKFDSKEFNSVKQDLDNLIFDIYNVSSVDRENLKEALNQLINSRLNS
ncbi:MAG: HsdM family class I SAM-dependent methyltransferase [Promethearchaeota archaeon]